MDESLPVPSLPGDEDFTRSVVLVRRAREGDAQAMNRLCDRYYERVRRIVRMRLGQKLRSAMDSGDILQETFAQAVQGLDRFEMRDEASLIHWLAKLAERQIIAAADYHAAKKRDRGREVRLAAVESGVGLDLPADVAVPIEQLSKTEQDEIVEVCISELSEEQRELIILRDYAGASWESIAKQTDRPSAAAARMMHSRALVELGKLVKRRGFS